MRRNGLFLVALVGTAALLLGLSCPVMAEVDTDGDGNADSADPAPYDPNEGGVYAGAVITYDVLMAGDLDATGHTGAVITISKSGVIFDGNGHRIIAPDASHGITGRYLKNVTVVQVEIIAPHTTGILLGHVTHSTVSGVTSVGPGGTGISMGYGNDNVVENCTLTGRAYGLNIGFHGNDLVQN